MRTSSLISSFQAAMAAVVLIGLLCATCNKNGTAAKPGTVSDSTNETKPALRGRLVFHSYSCYGCNDSRLFLYDFSAGTLTEISKGWTGLQNCMNAQFSPDGSKLVFMGNPAGSVNWDVFIWNTRSASPPVNLTGHLGSAFRDEDPKFSFQGNHIIFKQNGVLTLMDTLGTILGKFPVPQSEASMPYFSRGDSLILYAGTDGSLSNIYLYHIRDSSVEFKSGLAGIYSYYPITRDDTSFIFTSWYSGSNPHDQLYLGFFDNRAARYLPFNEPAGDYSDGCPAEKQFIFLSSTRKGSRGGYDLYVADMDSGNLWSLSDYYNGINSSNDELGCTYTPLP